MPTIRAAAARARNPGVTLTQGDSRTQCAPPSAAPPPPDCPPAGSPRRRSPPPCRPPASAAGPPRAWRPAEHRIRRLGRERVRLLVALRFTLSASDWASCRMDAAFCSASCTSFVAAESTFCVDRLLHRLLRALRHGRRDAADVGLDRGIGHRAAELDAERDLGGRVEVDARLPRLRHQAGERLVGPAAQHRARHLEAQGVLQRLIEPVGARSRSWWSRPASRRTAARTAGRP